MTLSRDEMIKIAMVGVDKDFQARVNEMSLDDLIAFSKSDTVNERRKQLIQSVLDIRLMEKEEKEKKLLQDEEERRHRENINEQRQANLHSKKAIVQSWVAIGISLIATLIAIFKD